MVAPHGTYEPLLLHWYAQQERLAGVAHQTRGEELSHPGLEVAVAHIVTRRDDAAFVQPVAVQDAPCQQALAAEPAAVPDADSSDTQTASYRAICTLRDGRFLEIQGHMRSCLRKCYIKPIDLHSSIPERRPASPREECVRKKAMCTCR